MEVRAAATSTDHFKSTSARKVCLLSHRTVPNEAGDHRAANEPPLGPWQGAVRLKPPYEKPPQWSTSAIFDVCDGIEVRG